MPDMQNPGGQAGASRDQFLDWSPRSSNPSSLPAQMLAKRFRMTPWLARDLAALIYGAERRGLANAQSPQRASVGYHPHRPATSAQTLLSRAAHETRSMMPMNRRTVPTCQRLSPHTGTSPTFPDQQSLCCRIDNGPAQFEALTNQAVAGALLRFGGCSGQIPACRLLVGRNKENERSERPQTVCVSRSMRAPEETTSSHQLDRHRRPLDAAHQRERLCARKCRPAGH